MAEQNTAWFVHALNSAVTLLAQQEESEVRGSIRFKEGVIGKTFPFNRLGPVRMSPMTERDGRTQYVNPPQSKRRAVLVDRAIAVMIDEFDVMKEAPTPQTEFVRLIVMSREVELDYLALNIPGLTAAGAAGTQVGGILGLATNVDEVAESTSTTALPASQFIADGGTGFTMAKLRQARRTMAEANVRKRGRRFLFYSPGALDNLLTDPQVTSADFSTIHALQRGEFPKDQSWMGFLFRESTVLPKVGNIRSAIAVHEDAAAMAIGLITDVKVTDNPERWNNWQAVLKLSAGVVRVDDAGVLQINHDETV